MPAPRVELVEALGVAEARAFAERWLPAWTGNDPERLVAFYTDDAFYSDPAVAEGVRGREALLAYFRKLLGRNPAWVWTHRGSIGLRDGFLNEWHASIPVGAASVEVDGVCTVQLRGDRIARNQVYFDRSSLLAALAAATKPSPQSSRFAPDGWPVMTPRIVAREARELVAFVKHVFGATGDHHADAPTILRIGESTLMVSDTEARDPVAAFLYVYVDDTDGVFARAVAAGARPLEEPRELPYGDRRGMVQDPWGNTWQIATYRGHR